MLSSSPKSPRVISVRVQKAEGLRIIAKSEHKQKKISPKWKVHFLGGKKKMSTESVLSPEGNPAWDYEVTFKVSRGEPVVLLVTDSDDHHVGQVVIPPQAMMPRPANPLERPTDMSRLIVADLEPTKKTPTAFGTLYYWLWVEEYRTDEADGRSTGGSVLSLASLRKHKKAGSVADSLNYSGSVISLSSNHGDLKDKKKPWFKKKLGKGALESVAALSERSSFSRHKKDPSLSKSTSNVFDPTSRNGSVRPLYGEYLSEEHDGSVLGASSDLTGSDFYGIGTPQRNTIFQSSQEAGLNNGKDFENNAVSDTPSVALPVPINRRPSPVREEPAEFTRNEDHRSTNDQRSSMVEPQLLAVDPSSCTPSGGVDVTVYCSGLTEDIVRYATVLVDGYAVPRQDWFHQQSESGKSELRIHMPERPTGKCWIELETMNHGRLRCQQEFTYVQPSANAVNGYAQANAAESPSMGRSPLVRTGSSRSSLLVRDRRSTRRGQAPSIAKPEATSAASADGARSDDSRSKDDTPEVDPNTNSVNVDSDRGSSEPSHFQRTGSRRSPLVCVDRRSTRRGKGDSPAPVQETESSPIVAASPSGQNEPSETPSDSPKPFVRAGSQRSSLSIVDRRSSRRGRPQSSVTPSEGSSEAPSTNETVKAKEGDQSLDSNPPTIHSEQPSSDQPAENSPFKRAGSLRSSKIVCLDRRSTRRNRPSSATTVKNSDSGQHTDSSERTGAGGGPDHASQVGENGEKSVSATSSPFVRTGSLRRSLLAVDRRSTRRNRDRPDLSGSESALTGSETTEPVAVAHGLEPIEPVAAPVSASHPQNATDLDFEHRENLSATSAPFAPTTASPGFAYLDKDNGPEGDYSNEPTGHSYDPRPPVSSKEVPSRQEIPPSVTGKCSYERSVLMFLAVVLVIAAMALKYYLTP
ncbi:unnamed protein product [Calicophoron daubneyi]|uniref:C2 domain-containing protein n=1 Tax=Calicophoron daubneyi TaxID=300641 RepID=A0AAV2TXW2_CALDB